MASALALAPAVAGAATVTFAGGEVVPSSLAFFDGRLGGIYREAGFDVGFQLVNPEVELDLEADPGVIAGQIEPARLTTLFNGGDGCSGCFSTSNAALRFTRTDGGTFGLDGISGWGSFNTTETTLTYYPAGSDGEPDYDGAVTATIDLVYDDLTLTGLRSNGSVVAATFATNLLPARDADFSTFTDLTSLTLGVPADFDLDSVSESIAMADVDPIFDLVPEDASECVLGPVGTGCEVEGMGFFVVDVTIYNGGNFLTATSVGDVELSPLAPVPLPASAWMLGTGLAGLGFAAWRRRAQGPGCMGRRLA